MSSVWTTPWPVKWCAPGALSVKSPTISVVSWVTVKTKTRSKKSSIVETRSSFSGEVGSTLSANQVGRRMRTLCGFLDYKIAPLRSRLVENLVAQLGEDLRDLAEQVVAVRAGEGAQVLAVPSGAPPVGQGERGQ